MMKEEKFKYQKQIDTLLALGCQLPELFAPNDMNACRFAFSEAEYQNPYPTIHEQSETDASGHSQWIR